jgi:hypothetical protein
VTDPPLAKGSCEKMMSLLGVITRIKFLRLAIFSFER